MGTGVGGLGLVRVSYKCNGGTLFGGHILRSHWAQGFNIGVICLCFHRLVKLYSRIVKLSLWQCTCSCLRQKVLPPA